MIVGIDGTDVWRRRRKQFELLPGRNGRINGRNARSSSCHSDFDHQMDVVKRRHRQADQ